MFILQKNASPSAEELERLRSKLLRTELELSSASDRHHKEYELSTCSADLLRHKVCFHWSFDFFLRIQRFEVLLKDKEESARKLKELLRKSQQHGEESCKKTPLFFWMSPEVLSEKISLTSTGMKLVKGVNVGSSPPG